MHLHVHAMGHKGLLIALQLHSVHSIVRLSVANMNRTYNLYIYRLKN